jgi:hypothetical protein
MHPADYRRARASTTSTRKKAELSLSAPQEATEAPTAAELARRGLLEAVVAEADPR